MANSQIKSMMMAAIQLGLCPALFQNISGNDFDEKGNTRRNNDEIIKIPYHGNEIRNEIDGA